jgi:hypothetical protein
MGPPEHGAYHVVFDQVAHVSREAERSAADPLVTNPSDRNRWDTLSRVLD